MKSRSAGGDAVTWQELPFTTGEPQRLLAEGAALLDEMSPTSTPIRRWYRATEPALILGRGQRGVLADVGDLPVVSRFSGGGAVLMNDSLLSLDVVFPAGHPWLTGAMTAVFGKVGGAWAAALRHLGVPDVGLHDQPGGASRRGTPREQLLAAICYATLGYGEVTVRGRKLVGLAQRRRRTGALVQCGLLRRWEPGPLLAAFSDGIDDPGVLDAAVGLDELVSPAPTDEAIMAAVNTALEEAMTDT